jgi:L-arabinokinase
VPTLLARLRVEMAASFVPGKSVRVSRAPGRLDVMGGIADYTGSLVCESTLDRAAAVAVQSREDRQIQVFSFNLLDDHRPFTLMLSMEHLATSSIADLRRAFGDRGRRWAGYLAGCLAILHDEKLLDLADPKVKGVNIALYSDVPLGAGVSSSAAIEVATMMNLVDHYGVGAVAAGVNPRENDATLDGSRSRVVSARVDTRDHDLSASTSRQGLTPMRVAAMCQRVENEIVGAPCGIMDQAASTAGEAGALMRLVCQPHELQAPLLLPDGIRAIGINSNVKHSVGGGQYGRTRCAAFMGHKIIVDKMRQMGAQSGREMVADPMNGYLANLDLNDYKKFFRPYLPETIKGGQFLLQYGPSIDRATSVEPDTQYHVQSATDHHVFEAHRVREFVRYLEEAARLDTADAGRKLLLDKAGHLMYASHISYTKDARLGADECDVLVDLVRRRESAGLYGAKITGGGSGGTVAVLCDISPSADAAIDEILAEYESKTGRKADAFVTSSPGAWAVGTASFIM